MKAVVTGGAGFIGSHVVDALAARGDRVVVVDDFSTGGRESLEQALSAGATLRVASVCDREAIRRIVAYERPDVIIHFAAQVDVARSILAPARNLRVNVEGTVNVLETASVVGVPRVVMASTGAIYGRAVSIPTSETADAQPLSPYGNSKHAAEGYCRLYERMHGISSVCLRFANVYGPRQRSDGEGGVVAILCARLLRGETATVFGDGAQTRDFVFVDDALRATLAAAESDVSGAVNVGTGVETSVLELIGALCALSPGRHGVVHLPPRLGEVRRSCLDATRARDALGWTARTSVREGLAETLDALRTRSTPSIVSSAPRVGLANRMPAVSLDVLVTGGAGFIGSHVVDCLRAAGHRPRIFDLRPSPWHQPGEVDTHIGDVDDLGALEAAMTGCDAVMHLAAAADVNDVRDDPVDAERRNTRGTLHVLEAARRCGVRRVVFASTIWVYSDTEGDCHEEDAALCAPAHLYTATKLAGELYCRAYRELYDLESTVLRFGIPYGPRARPATVVAAFVARALAGEPLTVAGDGRQSRRFVYVEDLADGVVRALAPVAANRTYNLVGTDDTTVAEIAETVRELVGGVEIVRVPGRAADFTGAQVDGGRAAAELGWRARTPFREGVRRYVDWYRAQPESPVPARARSARGAAFAPLLQRVALAALVAATMAVMLLGLASLVPVDPDLDVYDTLTATLVLLLPLTLAGGFAWPPDARRWVRGLCWAMAFGDLVVARVHPLFGLSAAVVAASAALLARERSPIAALLATGNR